jgi:DNA invertase Pin-like site-specific DNA recombinase
MEVDMLVGYARVSTGFQSLEAQTEALKVAGCEKIFAEKRSGADSERRELAKLLKMVRPEDTVVVCRLDRLARSTKDLLNTLDQLGKHNVGFKSLRETAVDTTSPQGRLVVSILAAIGEFEREIILSRITEGRKRAQRNGIKFGRKPKLTIHQRQEALERLAEGASQSDIARTFNVDRATISRLARR